MKGDDMNEVLMFLKSQWRTLLVIAWMIFITNKLFDIENAFDYYCDLSSVQSTVDDIEGTVEDIKSRVIFIYHEVQ